MTTTTYRSPLWPCANCGGTERHTRSRACVACNGKAAAPKSAVKTEPKEKAEERIVHNGFTYIKVAPKYGDWPLHTDFSPDNLTVRN